MHGTPLPTPHPAPRLRLEPHPGGGHARPWWRKVLPIAAASLLAVGLAGCGEGGVDRVTALDPAGPLASSSDGGPEVRIKDPDNGETVSGTVEIRVRARGDDFDLERTDLFIADERVATETVEEFTYDWSTEGHAGDQTITATATDEAGNTASASIVVTVASAGDGDDGGDDGEADGPGVLSVAVNPHIVTGGEGSTGTVGLTEAAPEGGTVVELASSDPAVADVPESVTVPAGETTASFPVSTSPVTSSTDVTITASAGNTSDTATLTVVPESAGTLASLAIEPDQVIGGEVATGTVVLEASVGADTEVTLTSSDETVATVPEAVIVPAGATSATFDVSTLPNTTDQGQFAVISGHAGGETRSASITTVGEPDGPALSAVELFPSTLGGGGPATAIVTFEEPLNDGVILAISSSNPSVVQVPEEETPQWFWSSTQRAFPVTTSAVTAETAVTITVDACCGAVGSATATLTVTPDAPPPPDVVEIDKARWTPGGRGGTLEVRAESTSETALLTVFIAGSDRELMKLRPVGGGRYEGEQSFGGGMTNPGEIDVISNLGGSDRSEVRD